MFDFENEINKVFVEAFDDDEENPDSSLALEPESEEDLYDVDDQEIERGRDWTNLLPPKKGKTLNDLKKVKFPLKSGWTEDEVMSALKPTLMAAARKYATPNFSQDEALLAAMEGVTDALRTDKGISVFTSHVFPAIKSRTMRAAAGTTDFPTSNISGIKPNIGGKTDFLKGSRATVSADTPVGDEGDATFSSRIAGDPTSGEKSAKEQMNIVKLLSSLFDSGEVGLSSTERVVMLATYGINSRGEYTGKGPQDTTAIANALGVSKVRVSQIRKKAQYKLQEFLASKGLRSPEEALSAFGLEEAKLILTAKMVLESMTDILNVDIEVFKEYIEVPVDVVVNGVVRHAIAKVNSESLSIDDVVAEGNESILGKVDYDSLVDARQFAKTRMSGEYFAETISSIVKIHAQPILAVIGATPEEDVEEDK